MKYYIIRRTSEVEWTVILLYHAGQSKNLKKWNVKVKSKTHIDFYIIYSLPLNPMGAAQVLSKLILYQIISILNNMRMWVIVNELRKRIVAVQQIAHR